MANENIIPDEKEFDEAIEEAKGAPGAVTIKFPKPVTHDGVEYSELTFDLGSLTGRDIKNIDDELAAEGRTVWMPETNARYLRMLAVRACTAPIGEDMLDRLPAKICLRIRRAVQNFLLSDAE